MSSRHGTVCRWKRCAALRFCLWRQARAQRMQRVMAPYLEALL